MTSLHRISDSLFDYIYLAVTTRHHWIAYKSAPYFLRKEDIQCFVNREEAYRFKEAAKASGEACAIIYAPSVLSVYRQIEKSHTIETIFSTSKINVMNEQNFEYLKDSLKYLGFGESLADKLRLEMQKGEAGFQLTFESEISRKAFAAVINVRKSDTTDNYFVNSYHATLQRSNGETVDQAFYLNKGKGVTAKEAFNLLEGRAVYKELENSEGQKYHAWLQLDFDRRDQEGHFALRQFHDHYGFELKAALDRLNIRDMREPDLAALLMASLRKGNLQAVTMEISGKVTRMFVEASPQYKTVTLYDSALKPVSRRDQQIYLKAAPMKEAARKKTKGLSQEMKKEKQPVGQLTISPRKSRSPKP